MAASLTCTQATVSGNRKHNRQHPSAKNAVGESLCLEGGKRLSHLRLDVHLLSCGIRLLAADGVVVAELVRVLGDVLLDQK